MITQDYLRKLEKVESGNNPLAKNPKSTAKGRFQFVDATAKQYGITAPFGTPEYTQQEEAAVVKFSQDNFNSLKKALKREPTQGELYLAHQQGAGGAVRLLSSPNALAVDVLGRDQVLNNGGNENMTAEEFAQKWTEKFSSIEGKMQGKAQIEGEVQSKAQKKYNFTKEQIVAELQRRAQTGVNAEVQISASKYTKQQVLAELQRRKKQQTEPGFLAKTYQSALKREENIQRIIGTAQQEGLPAAAAFIPRLGEAAAFFGEVGFDAASRILGYAFPEDTLIGGYSRFAGRQVINAASYVADTAPARFLSSEYKDFSEKHPLIAENIEGGIGTALFISPVFSGGAVKQAAQAVRVGQEKVRQATAQIAAETTEQTAKNSVFLQNQTQRALKRLLKSSNKSYDELLDNLKKTDVLTIADVAGDEVQGLTRALAKMKDAKNVIHGTLTQRSEEAVARVSAELSKRISNVENYFGSISELGKARSAASRPIYNRAYEEGVNIVDPRLDKFLSDQRIRDAIIESKKLYAVRLEAADNSLEALDGAKKVLYDLEGEAKGSNKPMLASAYRDIRHELVSVLDENVPTYAKARKVFESPSVIIDAQKAGRGFEKLQPEELKKIISEYQPHEREAFRIGVRQRLQEVVNTTTDKSDPAKRIFGNSQKRLQLETIFEDKAHYDEFAKRMRDEIAAFDTKAAILGGSRTDYNIASDLGFIDAVADAGRNGRVVDTLRDRALGATVDAIKRYYVGINRKNAAEVAEILVNREKGIKALQELLEKQTDYQQKAIVGNIVSNHAAVKMIDPD